MGKEILEIAIACIVSAGGIGGLIIGVIKFTSNQIAESLSKKYELKLEKELEKYKTELQHKEYISKARFDTEFQLYKELNREFCMMVKNISVMIPQGFAWAPADKEQKRKYENECYDMAKSAYVKAQDSLYGNAAFISQHFFDIYEQILRLGKMQLFAFEERFNVLSLESQEEKESFSRDDYKRTGEINEKWTELNNEIREYFKSLDVF